MWTEWRTTLERHFPDFDSLVASGKASLGPAAATALVVFAVGLLVTRKRAAVPAAALAVLAGFAVANYLYPLVPWWPEAQADPNRPLYPRFHGPHWLAVLFVLALLDGVLAGSAGVPAWGRWRLRLGLGLLAAVVLVPAGLHRTWPDVYASWPYLFRAWVWPLSAFTLWVALGWAGSARVCRESPGGAVGLGLAATLFGASLVVLHAHSGKVAEVLTVPAAALVGVAVVAAFARVEVTGAVSGIALLLPAALLIGATETDSQVPWYAFLLAGLPPLTIGLTALPPVSRLSGVWKGILFWVACLGPTVAAVIIAARAESLPTADDWALVPASVPCALT